jgi:hypothetical protein
MSMQFNETTNNSGMIQDCEFWLFGNDYGSISDNTEMLQTFTNNINRGLDKATAKLLQLDNKWQYDDSNISGLPEYPQNLVASQASYTIPADHLILKGVYVLDNTGDYYALRQISEREINDSGDTPDEFYDQDGYPLYYELIGDNIKLYPAPDASDVTLTNGLKTTYKRNSEYFVTTDTTKTSGLPENFQRLPVLYACYDYAVAHTLPKQSAILNEIALMERALADQFSDRSMYKRPRITVKTPRTR